VAEDLKVGEACDSFSTKVEGRWRVLEAVFSLMVLVEIELREQVEMVVMVTVHQVQRGEDHAVALEVLVHALEGK
jgi:hypothetical protein